MIFPHFKETQREQTTQFLIWLVGLAMLILGIGYFRLDVTTSALWFDGLELRPVDNQEFNFGLAFGQTVEGWMFGIALWVAQLYTGYRAALARHKQEKWTYIGIYITVAILDTATDMEWRTVGFRSDLLLKGLLISTVVYNLFSEMAIAVGFREFVTNLTVATFVLSKVFSEMLNGFGILVGTIITSSISMISRIKKANHPQPPPPQQQRFPQKPPERKPEPPKSRSEILAKMGKSDVQLAMGEIEE